MKDLGLVVLAGLSLPIIAFVGHVIGMLLARLLYAVLKRLGLLGPIKKILDWASGDLD